MRYGHLQNPPGPIPGDLIPTEAAAAILGLSPRTVRGMVYRGDLTGYYVGGRLLRVSNAEVAASVRVAVPEAGRR